MPYPHPHIPYPNAGNIFQRNDGYNAQHEGFIRYYSSDMGPNVGRGYEAGFSTATGSGPLVDYGNDDEELSDQMANSDEYDGMDDALS